MRQVISSDFYTWLKRKSSAKILPASILWFKLTRVKKSTYIPFGMTDIN